MPKTVRRQEIDAKEDVMEICGRRLNDEEYNPACTFERGHVTGCSWGPYTWLPRTPETPRGFVGDHADALIARNTAYIPEAIIHE